MAITGCATRWEGEALVRRSDDRIVLASVDSVFHSAGLSRMFDPCLPMNALKQLRAKTPGDVSMSCASVVVDLKAGPPNFYIAALSTPAGSRAFSFLGGSTPDGCERIREQLRESASFGSGWIDGRCQPAVLTIR